MASTRRRPARSIHGWPGWRRTGSSPTPRPVVARSTTSPTPAGPSSPTDLTSWPGSRRRSTPPWPTWPRSPRRSRKGYAGPYATSSGSSARPNRRRAPRSARSGGVAGTAFVAGAPPASGLPDAAGGGGSARRPTWPRRCAGWSGSAARVNRGPAGGLHCARLGTRPAAPHPARLSRYGAGSQETFRESPAGAQDGRRRMTPWEFEAERCNPGAPSAGCPARGGAGSSEAARSRGRSQHRRVALGEPALRRLRCHRGDQRCRGGGRGPRVPRPTSWCST